MFECATGLAVFTSEFAEEIGKSVKSVQDSVDDVAKFAKMVKLVSFVPFVDAAHALEVANDVSEGVVHEFLHGLLELNLAKKAGVVLGVEERGLASSIKATLAIECDASDRTLEVLRGIRLHQEKLLAGLEQGDTKRSQLGLGHAYSRAKVKFNVNRSDNMIIQAIALLDQLDKDVNTFAMRVREWYGWHFPELVRVVPDNYQYAKVCRLLGDKAQLDDDILEPLAELLDNNDTLARNILDASRASMGTDISEVDHLNIKNFATRVIHLYDYRKSLQAYLSDKMGVVAPNLAALIGDTVGARLISHAGSLTNLSKYPASTVQILGAEKALFRALKTKGNTPKYGLIYHSTFIGRAGAKNKGRIRCAPTPSPLPPSPRLRARSLSPSLGSTQSLPSTDPDPSHPPCTQSLPRQQVLDRVAHRLLRRPADDQVRPGPARPGRGAPLVLRERLEPDQVRPRSSLAIGESSGVGGGSCGRAAPGQTRRSLLCLPSLPPARAVQHPDSPPSLPLSRAQERRRHAARARHGQGRERRERRRGR